MLPSTRVLILSTMMTMSTMATKAPRMIPMTSTMVAGSDLSLTWGGLSGRSLGLEPWLLLLSSTFHFGSKSVSCFPEDDANNKHTILLITLN